MRDYSIKSYKNIVTQIKRLINIEDKGAIENGSHLFVYNHKYYLVSDNGGETNLDVINTDEYIAVNHTDEFVQRVPDLVTAYRIATCLKLGIRNVNWEIRKGDIQEVLTKFSSKDAIWYKLQGKS